MFYKRNRGKLIKQLQQIDPIDNPNQYKLKYKELYNLYKYYKSSKYNDKQIIDKLDNFLKSKSLTTFKDIVNEENEYEKRLSNIEKQLEDLKKYCIIECKKNENLCMAMAGKFKLIDRLVQQQRGGKKSKVVVEKLNQ